MIAVALDRAALRVAVAGRGSAALRRFHALRSGGAGDLQLFCDQPGQDDLAGSAGDALRHRLPNRNDLAALRALWIAGLPDEQAAELAVLARSERVLVNVEDQPTLSEFHSVAEVRRGDLLLTVSTGGASPGLAAAIRARLAAEYGPEWGERLATLRSRRAGWRQDGRGPAEVAALTDALLHDNGWLA